jgi:hypothetical protein
MIFTMLIDKFLDKIFAITSLELSNHGGPDSTSKLRNIHYREDRPHLVHVDWSKCL